MFRWLLRAVIAIAWLSSSAAGAIDCLAIANAADKDSITPCGPVSIHIKTRTDALPQVEVSATYVRFEAPTTDAQRAYNQWIDGLLKDMLFAGDVKVPPDGRFEQLMEVERLYLSPRLLSARASLWTCCGAHGYGSFATFNFDLVRGGPLQPDGIFRLDAVADFCWQKFAALPNQGGDDFRQRITRQFLSSALKAQEGWSFTEDGAVIYFGYLLAYAGGPYFCQIGNDHLRATAREGVSIPL